MGGSNILFETSSSSDPLFLESIENFYAVCGKRPAIGEETLLRLKIRDEIVGAVRLAFEGSIWILRSMQIKPNYQNQGLGRRLLLEFKKTIYEKKIDVVYCIPYFYLEKFYGSIGFEKIPEFDAPDLLQQRIRDYRERANETDFIMMQWNLKKSKCS